MKKIDYTPKFKPTKFQRFGKGPVPSSATPRTLVVENVPVRATRDIPSFFTPGGSTALKPTQQYSGDAMLGVSQLHKSNSVPVFSTQEIHDISKMRR